MILDEARRLGFALAGVTVPDPPPHFSVFEAWLSRERHASMDYLASDRARARRANPRLILPECKSILVLAVPYSNPTAPKGPANSPLPREALRTAEDAGELPAGAFPAPKPGRGTGVRGRIAAYAWGDDYHLVLPKRLQALARFIQAQVGRPVANRWYTDTGPILERDLAQRAGLGWIGKNTCLINPRQGSYFLLAEILLDLELQPDAPFTTDHCGTCTRCLEACPTGCILPDRTIDARRCISYLTIERKDSIPEDLRLPMADWIFGCDVCQMVCPWNRFAAAEGDSAFRSDSDTSGPELIGELQLSPADFNRKYKRSSLRRPKRRGYLRNVAIALGNSRDPQTIPALEESLEDPEQLLREHASWAIHQIR